jgi:hypothetical protein
MSLIAHAITTNGKMIDELWITNDVKGGRRGPV